MAADNSMSRFAKVIVIGLDGLEPTILEPMVAAGELPALAALWQGGGYARVATTTPAQTPVAWSTFATGVNPGGHGVFDFLGRDPQTYLPQLALNRYEQKNPFVPPRVVNMRRAEAFWQVLSEAGVPSVVLRCPCTYPPETINGRVLAGMGVPDVRGSLGMSTLYTSRDDVVAGEGENVIHVTRDDGRVRTVLRGPLHPKTRQAVEQPLVVAVEADHIAVRLEGQSGEVTVLPGQWSDWLQVKFKLNLLQSVRGIVRFYLIAREPLQLYASPINYDPQSPPFPLSAPADYAAELTQRVGTFYTAGMPEDHNGLVNQRIDEPAFLQQCELVLSEREAMLFSELGRFDDGFLFCLFDTPDRIQHVFWRARDPQHPANRQHGPSPLEHVIEDHYRRCDHVVREVLAHVDDRTLLMVLSDHGCGTFRRGLHLNAWLHDQGLLVLRSGCRPGEQGGSMLRHVDWTKTKAYAVGLGGIYLNQRGRESQGIVTREEAPLLQQQIATSLDGLRDPAGGETAVQRVLPREAIYRGAYVAEAPDLLVHFAAGYRASWGTALGDVPQGWFEDNTRLWSGDHIVDPRLTPGVLMMNRPFRTERPNLLDLAPTILSAFGVPRTPVMEGQKLLA